MIFVKLYRSESGYALTDLTPTDLKVLMNCVIRHEDFIRSNMGISPAPDAKQQLDVICYLQELIWNASPDKG